MGSSHNFCPDAAASAKPQDIPFLAVKVCSRLGLWFRRIQIRGRLTDPYIQQLFISRGGLIEIISLAPLKLRSPVPAPALSHPVGRACRCPAAAAHPPDGCSPAWAAIAWVDPSPKGDARAPRA